MAIDDRELKDSLLSFWEAVVAKLGRKSEREGISTLIKGHILPVQGSIKINSL
jgi:hypothetical protein